MKRVNTMKKAELVALWRESADMNKYLWKSAAEHIWYVIKNNSRKRAICRLQNYAKKCEKMAIHCYYVQVIKQLKAL